MSTRRLGDIALDGAIALLQICIKDHQSLGDQFEREQWDALGKMIECDALQFEVDRLDPLCPKSRELSALLAAYYEAVWPRWREVPEERQLEAERKACPLFAEQMEGAA